MLRARNWNRLAEDDAREIYLGLRKAAEKYDSFLSVLGRAPAAAVFGACGLENVHGNDIVSIKIFYPQTNTRSMFTGVKLLF